MPPYMTIQWQAEYADRTIIGLFSTVSFSQRFRSQYNQPGFLGVLEEVKGMGGLQTD